MIKKLLAAAMLVTASYNAQAQDGKALGASFKTEGAWKVDELGSRMGDKTEVKDVVLSGEITEVCQIAGCWVKLKGSDGEDVFVKFKDGKVVVPKDMAGHHAYVYGKAVRKTISVEDQRHYAEDGGKSEAEIAKITEPKTQLRIEATGAVIE